jgi:hypothetical protein
VTDAGNGNFAGLSALAFYPPVNQAIADAADGNFAGLSALVFN